MGRRARREGRTQQQQAACGPWGAARAAVRGRMEPQPGGLRPGLLLAWGGTAWAVRRRIAAAAVAHARAHALRALKQLKERVVVRDRDGQVVDPGLQGRR